MGCIPSKSSTSRNHAQQTRRKIALREWRSETPLTVQDLARKRQEFWETQPYYGGDKGIRITSLVCVLRCCFCVVVWETLEGVANADMEMKHVFIDSAGLIVGSDDLTVFYDQKGMSLLIHFMLVFTKGYRYELPRYVLSEPLNLIRETQNPETHEPTST